MLKPTKTATLLEEDSQKSSVASSMRIDPQNSADMTQNQQNMDLTERILNVPETNSLCNYPQNKKYTEKTSWRNSKKIKEETCFEGEYLHKYVKLSEKFDSHHDFMQAMSDGAFKDVLDEKRKRYDAIQFRINILTEKITDTGKVQTDSFHICTEREKNDSNFKYLEKIREQVIKRVEKHDAKGSGLHYDGVKEFVIAFYTRVKIYSEVC